MGHVRSYRGSNCANYQYHSYRQVNANPISQGGHASLPPTPPSTRTRRDEAASRRLRRTLGLNIVIVLRLPRPVPHRVPCHTLAAFSSPCHQRRLSLSYQARVTRSVLSAATQSKSSALATSCTPVSHWLAPEGAKPIECRRHLPFMAKDKVAGALGSWPVVSCGPSVRRCTPVASLVAAASLGAAPVGWEASSPRTVLAPTRLSTRTLRDEAAQRRLHSRWAS